MLGYFLQILKEFFRDGPRAAYRRPRHRLKGFSLEHFGQRARFYLRTEGVRSCLKRARTLFQEVGLLKRSAGRGARPSLSAKAASDAQPVRVGDLLSQHFSNCSPLVTILSRRQQVRINLVTDSLGESSLFGGVATSLLFGTLLARRLDCQLRVITRDTTSTPSKVREVCRLHDVPPPRQLSFANSVPHSSPAESFKIDVSESDIFLATSWWSAQAVRQATLRKRYIYLVQEYEPIFYPAGDEQILAREIFNDERMIPIVNTGSLYRFFRERGYEHISNQALVFEPAFSGALYQPGRRSFEDKKRHRLWFYARPRMPRNLYLTGLYLLDRAVSEGVLDPSSWEISMVGSHLEPVTLSDGTRPRVLGKMTWQKYSKAIRDVDLGLCLMYAPTPSYPPLDLAASGSVALTNTFAAKGELDYSKNIVFAQPERAGLMEGFARAIGLARDPERRRSNYERNNLSRSWAESFADTLDRLPSRLGLQ